MEKDEDVQEWELWEGCMTWKLPKGLIDVRTIRRLPENQEAFMSKENDQSWMFDLLEMLDSSEREDVVTHWLEICDQNNAETVGDIVPFVIGKVRDPIKRDAVVEVHGIHGIQSSQKGKVREQSEQYNRIFSFISRCVFG